MKIVSIGHNNYIWNMQCLETHIGLTASDCYAEPVRKSDSGHHLSQLPGMSTELLENIRTGDQATILTLWNDCKKMAFLRLATDFQLALSEKTDWLTSILHTVRPPETTTEAVMVLLADYGVAIRLPESKYGRIILKGFWYDAFDLGSAAVPVMRYKIVSLKTGKTLVAGVEITPDETGYFAFEKPLVYSDSVAVLLTQTNVPFYNFDASDNAHECCECECECSDAPEFRFVKLLGGVFTYNEPVRPIFPDATIGCPVDAVICRHKDNATLTEVLLNLLGCQLLEYKMNANIGTQRLNFFTTSNLAQTEKTHAAYLKRYTESLKRFVASIKIDDPFCTDCSQQSVTRYVSVMP